MRPFIKRALQKLDQNDNSKSHNFIMSASREIDRLETVLDSLVRGILVCDTANKLILANKAARRFLSIVSYEQARETVWSVIREDLIAEFLAATLLSQDKAEEKEFNVVVNDKMRLLSVSIMPLIQNRRVTGTLIIIDDITERRAREAKLRRMENLASLTTLAAGVAHEIKNPLGSLSIHVQLIQKILNANRGKEAYFSQIDKYLNVLNEEIDRLNSIVVDFLFAVRPMNAELRQGNINELIRDVSELVGPELKAANIELIVNQRDNLSPVCFDPALIKMALLNLIKNAQAAIGDGGRIIITTEETEREVLIGVADTGSGIPEEIYPKIFDPYFTTKADGTGLGLTLVFKIMKEHQGEINVFSRVGEGSVFTMALPIPQIEKRLLAFKSPEESDSESAEPAMPVGRDK